MCSRVALDAQIVLLPELVQVDALEADHEKPDRERVEHESHDDGGVHEASDELARAIPCGLDEDSAAPGRRGRRVVVQAGVPDPPAPGCEDLGDAHPAASGRALASSDGRALVDGIQTPAAGGEIAAGRAVAHDGAPAPAAARRAGRATLPDALCRTPARKNTRMQSPCAPLQTRYEAIIAEFLSHEGADDFQEQADGDDEQAGQDASLVQAQIDGLEHTLQVSQDDEGILNDAGQGDKRQKEDAVGAEDCPHHIREVGGFERSSCKLQIVHTDLEDDGVDRADGLGGRNRGLDDNPDVDGIEHDGKNDEHRVEGGVSALHAPSPGIFSVADFCVALLTLRTHDAMTQSATLVGAEAEVLRVACSDYPNLGFRVGQLVVPQHGVGCPRHLGRIASRTNRARLASCEALFVAVGATRTELANYSMRIAVRALRACHTHARTPRRVRAVDIGRGLRGDQDEREEHKCPSQQRLHVGPASRASRGARAICRLPSHARSKGLRQVTPKLRVC
mmetsp:Transcript_155253/g.498102  ORF Transcript_155253/g.498102 Transcript_155253/m.498102 type:complete len:508 (-) Transcript_155253:8-1531(-)